MINLHLAIYDGDIPSIPFIKKEDLIDYIYELQRFDCVWLFATKDGDAEIIITESIDFLISIIKIIQLGKNVFLQEYQSYEDAYSVALDMKLVNPKCYNNE